MKCSCQWFKVEMNKEWRFDSLTFSQSSPFGCFCSDLVLTFVSCWVICFITVLLTSSLLFLLLRLPTIACILLLTAFVSPFLPPPRVVGVRPSLSPQICIRVSSQVLRFLCLLTCSWLSQVNSDPRPSLRTPSICFLSPVVFGCPCLSAPLH